jgi:TPR repeat protein
MQRPATISSARVWPERLRGLLLGLALAAQPAAAAAQSPVAATTEARRTPVPVDIPPPAPPVVPTVPPVPLAPPAPPPMIDRARGLELYQQAHDAMSAKLPDLANMRFAEACRFDEMRSCFNVGLDLEARATKPAAPASLRRETVSAYGLSCRLGFDRGCAAQGRLLLDKAWGEPQPERAVRLFEQSCRRNEPEACEQLAGVLYLGDPLRQDLSRAAELFRQACDRGRLPLSCFNYGLMAERGRGIARDMTAALAYYRQACRHGSLAGCHNLAVQYAEELKTSERIVVARNLLRSGCERNYIASCTTLGQLYRQHFEPRDDPAEAVAALTKACSSKDGLACRILGNMAHERVGVPGGDRAANVFYDRSCKLGYGPGCYNLGLVYWSGYKVRANAETAMAWFGEGCRLRSASSCAGAYLATLNLPAGHPLAGQDMAARWLAQGQAIDPANDLVKSVQEAFESQAAKAKTTKP